MKSPTSRPWIKNAWYQAAWNFELKENEMLAKKILNIPLVFFRDPSGKVRVLKDQCPHRFAPLSIGELKEDGSIMCGYHGLCFNGAGECTDNPHGRIFPGLHVETYVVVEKYEAIWVWLGEKNWADESQIPDWSFVSAMPEASRAWGYLHNTVDYRLMIDNILDLSHADYLHADTLGGGITTKAKTKVVDNENSVKITWTAESEELPPLMAEALGGKGAVGDYQASALWSAPSQMLIDVRFGPEGTVENLPYGGLGIHSFTPETERTLHYFYCTIDERLRHNPEMTSGLKAALEHVFKNEDGPMVRAQNDNIGGRDFWEMNPILLPVDKAAGKVRRKMDAMIAADELRERDFKRGEIQEVQD